MTNKEILVKTEKALKVLFLAVNILIKEID